ncbi:MAG TPA: universal stress protein [Gemmataceae bacterium]|jgi:nucleotide-binding universal stress UspA family protein|nr:universal stress protein [Gemmataceae bacterium]
MLPIRTILFSTDFSECSEAAFQLASSLARDYNARLIVLHVYPPPLDHSEEVARRPPDSYEESLWKNLKTIRANDLKYDMDYQLVEGEAAQEILRIAAEKPCDLIVMGTHGRTGLERFLLGSVAEQVVRQAACPVLTTKPAPM